MESYTEKYKMEAWDINEINLLNTHTFKVSKKLALQ